MAPQPPSHINTTTSTVSFSLLVFFERLVPYSYVIRLPLLVDMHTPLAASRLSVISSLGLGKLVFLFCFVEALSRRVRFPALAELLCAFAFTQMSFYRVKLTSY
jgi:hypothetical protein